MYTLLKGTHVACAALTFVSFSVRGMWMLAGSALLKRRSVRIVPHVIDTLLLASAIGLMLIVHQYPGTHGWLNAKVLALVLYIVLGSLALHHGRTPAVRALAFIAALAVFGYIVAVALTRNALPLFSVS